MMFRYECVVVIVVEVACSCRVLMIFESNSSMVGAIALIALDLSAVKRLFTSH